MLTRKQMEDAANCEKEIGNADFDYQEKMCKKCSCSDGHGRCAATFEAAQTALALADMLKRLEWCNDGAEFGKCHVCGVFDVEGHKPDCELAALLKGLEVGK